MLSPTTKRKTTSNSTQPLSNDSQSPRKNAANSARQSQKPIFSPTRFENAQSADYLFSDPNNTDTYAATQLGKPLKERTLSDKPPSTEIEKACTPSSQFSLTTAARQHETQVFPKKTAPLLSEELPVIGGGLKNEPQQASEHQIDLNPSQIRISSYSAVDADIASSVALCSQITSTNALPFNALTNLFHRTALPLAPISGCCLASSLFPFAILSIVIGNRNIKQEHLRHKIFCLYWKDTLEYAALLKKVDSNPFIAAEISITKQLAKKYLPLQYRCKIRLSSAIDTYLLGVLTLSKGVVSLIHQGIITAFPAITSVLGDLVNLVPISFSLAGPLLSAIALRIAYFTRRDAILREKEFCEGAHLAKIALTEAWNEAESDTKHKYTRYRCDIFEKLKHIENTHKKIRLRNNLLVFFSYLNLITSLISAAFTIATIAGSSAFLASPAGWITLLVFGMIGLSAICLVYLCTRCDLPLGTSSLVDTQFLLRLTALADQPKQQAVSVRIALSESLLARREALSDFINTSIKATRERSGNRIFYWLNSLKSHLLQKNRPFGDRHRLNTKDFLKWLPLEEGQAALKHFAVSYCKAELAYQELKADRQKELLRLYYSTNALIPQPQGGNMFLPKGIEDTAVNSQLKEIEIHLNRLVDDDSEHASDLKAFENPENILDIESLLLKILGENPDGMGEDDRQKALVKILETELPLQIENALEMLPSIEIRASQLIRDIKREASGKPLHTTGQRTQAPAETQNSVPSGQCGFSQNIHGESQSNRLL